MSSVEPNDVTYDLCIPESTIDYGYLSALQLETIVYTCQTHNTRLPSGARAGFLIGQFGNNTQPTLAFQFDSVYVYQCELMDTVTVNVVNEYMTLFATLAV